MRQPGQIIAIALIGVSLPLLAQQRTVRVDTLYAAQTVEGTLKNLEAKWNDAHVHGDTAELKRQWADDIAFVIPGMPTFNRDEVMALWRSGRAKVLRHETSDVTVRPYRDSAVVEGRLRRQRDFSGRTIEDDWRFTKTFVRRHGRWQVVAYRASGMPLSQAGSTGQQGQSRDSALFVIRIGQDTSRYMWLIRDGRRLTTISANRIPTLRVLRGVAMLDNDWSVVALNQETFDPAATNPNAPLSRTRVSTTPDSTFVDVGLDTDMRRTSYRGRGHFINTPHFFETLAVIGSHPLPVGDSLVGQHFAGTLFPPQRFVVRRVAADRATAFSRPLGVVRMKLGPQGEVVEFDGSGTSALNFTGVRVPWRDVDRTIADLLQLERSGRSFGALSARDSINVTVNGARIRLDFGRPIKRGRPIFGNIVPYDTTWRTGANRATHFRTDRDLTFGDKVLPAGEYSMWTLPSTSTWTLIFNAQTGQWGTEYDRSQDVLRVPMRARVSNISVEQFTIFVEPEGRGGVMRLIWDTTEAWVNFGIR